MFKKPPANSAPAPNGMEIMFRSLGLGPALDAAKAFAEAGGVQKIAEFANALPEINARLARIERLLAEPGSNPSPRPAERVEHYNGSSEPDGNPERSARPGGARGADHGGLEGGT